jgi:ATP-dependent DNA ligase
MQTFTFKSKSGNGEYQTVLADDGKLLCNCKGWTVRRNGQARACTHTKQVVTDLGLGTEVRGEYTYITTTGGTDPAPVKKVQGKAPVRAAVAPPVAVAHVPIPMLASAMVVPVKGAAFDAAYASGWAMEEKLDGHRVVVVKAGEGVSAFSRPRADGVVHARELAPHVIAALGHLADGIYDGELVVPGGNAWNVVELGAHTVLVLFDVLDIDGVDLKKLPYSERRERLLDELRKLPLDQQGISTVESLDPSWDAIEAIWKRGGEGAVLKRLASTYTEDWRSPDWVKVKAKLTAVLTITGFEAGKMGPFSKFILRDEATGIVTTVKTLGNALLREIEKRGPDFYIGQRMVVTYQQKTPDGKFRHIQMDHFAGEGE